MNFENLLNKLSPTLKRITHKLNGRFTFFDDEDLFQEAALRLYFDFNEGKLFDKTDSYILQGCYFHLKNYIRTVEDKAKIVSLEDILKSSSVQVYKCTSQNTNFDYLDNQSVLKNMQKCGLTDREKQVMFFLKEGLTVREIGKKLGISHVMVVKIKRKIKEKILVSYQNL